MYTLNSRHTNRDTEHTGLRAGGNIAIILLQTYYSDKNVKTLNIT